MHHHASTWLDRPRPGRIDLVNRIKIDLNVRVAGHLTYAGFEDVVPEGSVVRLGEQVLAWEPECGMAADAVVHAIDDGTETVYLDVDWKSLRSWPFSSEILKFAG